MVSHHAEHSLVVVCGGLRGEGDNDSSLRLGINGPLDFGERKHILIISEELERRWKVTVVTDVQKSVSVAAELHFAEMHGFR